MQDVVAAEAQERVYAAAAEQRIRIDAAGDHRMAMAAAVAGACASQAASRTVITGWESVATSYPPHALRKPDGGEWWDGQNWRRVPSSS